MTTLSGAAVGQRRRWSSGSNRTDGYDRGDNGGHDVGDPAPGRRYDRDLPRQLAVLCTFLSPFIPISGVALHLPAHTTSPSHRPTPTPTPNRSHPPLSHCP